jgi:hypothetical protein
MSSTPQSASAPSYLESLMRVGQDAMKQFDDALASATGVQTKKFPSSGRPLSEVLPGGHPFRSRSGDGLYTGLNS